MNEQDLIDNNFYLDKTNLKNIIQSFSTAPKLNDSQNKLYLSMGLFFTLKKVNDSIEKRGRLGNLIKEYLNMNRKFDSLKINQVKSEHMIKYYQDVFYSAELIDKTQQNSFEFENKFIGPARLMIERHYFAPLGASLEQNWTDSDLEFMNKIFKEDYFKKKYSSVFSVPNLLYKIMNRTDEDGLKYCFNLAELVDSKHIPDSEYFFLSNSRSADYGFILALRDITWKLPKGETQRFVEKVLDINKQNLLIDDKGNLIQN